MIDDFDGILDSSFCMISTKRFCVIDFHPPSKSCKKSSSRRVYVDLNCTYTRKIVIAAINRRPWCTLCTELDTTGKYTPPLLQFSDFENIEWEFVVSGRHGAASYLIRKGISRKAQLALQIKRFIAKNRTSVLAHAVPFTLILETWNAFDEMKLDFGGGAIATFDLPPTPLRTRLTWCLEEVKMEMEHEDRSDWLWILKPSVINKGIDISVCKDWEGALGSLESVPDIREWVLQRYIADPLLIHGNKFHLRVYVLCVGALQVYVFDRILMLLAAHKYNKDDLDDIYCHLTNTARAAETQHFDEENYVKILEDLPFFLGDKTASRLKTVESIKNQIHSITGELFRAFENEYTVFAPMPHCFELYGLDFLVDDALGVHLLEVNPGPDFKQTGSRLRRVIVELWEQTCSIVLDGGHAEDFSLVYEKEWSVGKLESGIKIFEN